MHSFWSDFALSTWYTRRHFCRPQGSVRNDATLKFYIRHSLLQVRAHPLKKCLSFGRHGFPAAMTGSNGDPVSLPTILHLYAQWSPNNLLKKNADLRLQANKKSACVFVCATYRVPKYLFHQQVRTFLGNGDILVSSPTFVWGLSFGFYG